METHITSSAKQPHAKYGTRDLLRLIMTHAHPKKGLFVIGILLSFVATICSLGITLMLKEFIDAFNHGTSGQLLLRLGAVIVVQLFASVASSFLLSYIRGRRRFDVAERVMATYRGLADSIFWP